MDAFRWVHENSDSQLWGQVLQAFRDELTPDQPTSGSSPLDVYGYKYLQKVGIYNRALLVIVGHRPAKVATKDNAWDEYYSAFNLDLTTGRKTAIEHAGRMWQWKFVRLARFSPPAPDVTFRYLTCTECEPDTMFSSFHYDEGKSSWQMRPWGNGKDLWWTASDGLVVELDIIGDGGPTFFDCVYGILSSQEAGFQNVAMRCKEFEETDSGESKVTDNTVLYSLSGGQFKMRLVTEAAEVADLTRQMCKPTVKSILCQLPSGTSLTAGQHEILSALFPKASRKNLGSADFNSLKRGMAMSEIVSIFGLPDELGGSGTYVFSYRLSDGTYVNISTTGTSGPIFYANHLDAQGHGNDLVPVR